MPRLWNHSIIHISYDLERHPQFEESSFPFAPLKSQVSAVAYISVTRYWSCLPEVNFWSAKHENSTGRSITQAEGYACFMHYINRPRVNVLMFVDHVSKLSTADSLLLADLQLHVHTTQCRDLFTVGLYMLHHVGTVWCMNMLYW